MEVEQTNWPPEHSQALRECHAKGMSYSEIAKVLNARFGAFYTRNAALGRAKRMGLVDLAQKGAPKPRLKKILRDRASRTKSPEARCVETKPSAPGPAMVKLLEFGSRRPAYEPDERVVLRCAEVSPRHLSLVDLERKDCRYPYGGDEEGEPVTFCGHPRRKGSSYCTPHFHLTRDPVIPPERAVSTAPLRLVDVDEVLEKVLETNAHGTDETQEAVQSRESA